MKPHLLALAVALAWPGAPARAQELRIAAASDLQSVFPRLVARFEAETRQRVTVTFGSSGNFFSQIQNGAPFDLFFSADVDYPRRLVAADLAFPGSRYTYATGRLVLWTRKDSPVELSRGLAALGDVRIRRIAIANPAHAPYGRAAVAALQHAGLYDSVRDRLVLGENVSQAAQFVLSGNAEAGLIALSLALDPALAATGAFVEIPAAFHPSLEQAAVVLTHGRHPEAARQFLRLLARPDSVRVLQESGFAPPPAGPR